MFRPPIVVIYREVFLVGYTKRTKSIYKYKIYIEIFKILIKFSVINLSVLIIII